MRLRRSNLLPLSSNSRKDRNTRAINTERVTSPAVRVSQIGADWKGMIDTPMKLSDAFDLFITDAIAAGRSPYTLKWYRQYIGRMIRYLGNVELDAVSVDNVREFLASLWSADKKWVGHKYHKPVSGNLAVPTVAGYVRAIKSFYNWLEENDHITAEQNLGRRLKKSTIAKSGTEGSC